MDSNKVILFNHNSEIRHISNYIGKENFKMLENNPEAMELLLYLNSCNKLYLFFKAITEKSIYFDDFSDNFIFVVTGCLCKNSEFKKIRNEVFEYIGLDLLKKYEHDPKFQELCVKLHVKQYIFKENLSFIKRLLLSDFFKLYNNSAIDFSLLDNLLLLDDAYEMLDYLIFSKNLDLKTVTVISKFMLSNNIKKEEFDTVFFVFNSIIKCTFDDLNKIFMYKAEWKKIKSYVKSGSLTTSIPYFTRASSFVIFIKFIPAFDEINGLDEASLIFDKISDYAEKLNKNPRLVAINICKELNLL